MSGSIGPNAGQGTRQACEKLFMQTVAQPYLTDFGYSTDAVGLSLKDWFYCLSNYPPTPGWMTALQILDAARNRIRRQAPRRLLSVTAWLGSHSAGICRHRGTHSRLTYPDVDWHERFTTA